MSAKWLRTPGVLGAVIIITTGGIMMLMTAYRYSQRRQDANAQSTAESLKPDRYEVAYRELGEVQPFELIERSGEPVTLAELEGEPLVFSFFFTRCPSICKQQNNAIQRLQLELRDLPIRFVSISCDPAHDTPAVLRDYAKQYNADPSRWLFLTGANEKVVAVGKDSFNLPIGPETHSTSLLLVDKWGRFRDRFDWKEVSELMRFREVIEQVVSETEPPLDEVLLTRAPVPVDDVSNHAAISDQTAVSVDDSWANKPWIDEFTLMDSNGKAFGSKDLEGQVWVANTFFSRCPTICTKLMTQVQQLQASLKGKPVGFVSITTDSKYDTPARLKAYGEKFSQDPDQWHLLTGDPLYCRRVMSEYLKLFVEMEGPEHDEHLVLVDKWGNVRGKYVFSEPEQIAELRSNIDRLMSEEKPPVDPEEAARLKLLEEARRAEQEAEGRLDDATSVEKLDDDSGRDNPGS